MMRRLAGFKIAVHLLLLSGCGGLFEEEYQPDLESNGGGRNGVPGSEKDFAINVGDRIYFIVDQTDLTPEAQETLRRQAAWLRQYPKVRCRSKAMPTSAARVNTISRCRPGAPPRPANS